MDTSKIYVKMCNYPLIQVEWKPTEGDWMFVDKPIILGTQVFGLPSHPEKWPSPAMRIAVPREAILIKIDDGEPYPKPSYRTIEFELKKFVGIWLPRQDQIQEMMDNDYDHISTMVLYFYLFTNNLEMYCGLYAFSAFEIPLSSLEQLWLAFYMWERHKLIWDGEKWVYKPTEGE